MNRRLLYVIGELHGGGSERQLCYLLRGMDRTRHEPAVAVWNYSEHDLHVSEIRALDIPLYSLSSTVSRCRKLAALRRLVRRLRPAVVHSWSFYTNFAAYLATRGSPALAVGSIRSGFPWAVEQCGPLLGRLSARWPRHRICNSFSAAESARTSVSGLVRGHVHVVCNGVDLNRYSAEPALTQPPVRILGVGYLLPVKRWDLLISAVQELTRQGVDCLVQIAGDGPSRAALAQLAIDLGVADRIQFLGQVDDVPRRMAEASIVVHTADSEGCPNAVMEAMACGRAVVATDAGDISLLVDDGVTGFLVPRLDIALLAERLATLIADANLRASMGNAARAKAARRFALERLVTDTLAVYRACGWDAA